MTVARARAALLLVIGALAGCRGAAPAAAPAERSYDDPGLGASFALPATWLERVEGDAVVFSGPAGTDAYYTPLTLQVSAAAAGEADLAHVLERTYGAIESDRAPVFLVRTPARVAGAPAIRYLVSFDWNERPRLRAGVIVASPGAVWHLAYTASPELFASGLGTFERALDTVALAPPDGGAP